ncbi:hypothetical protein [Mesorhizobium sp. ORS 3428]|uniref:Uncharacterized protein n=1 Tax=Mesorhizobium plurifarium TaxID=69974 RepID=A0A090EU42_MESPL|nr:hypothetical protein [Mesorhizobium sp. ORS 3428]OHV76174.1 hypothetical protein ORS3428_28960 [Mesorhizobium sp. ORS 3428]CDX35144.1 conserved hypothetical protein [Mesorhizobium plurifarium]CDX38558.1 conserved hypothetical protein [Mesorhizobium sp. SOD10]
MRQTKKALPFVPSEFRTSTLEDSKGMIDILSIHTTEGLLDIALDAHAACANLNAIGSIRSKLGLHKESPVVSRAQELNGNARANRRDQPSLSLHPHHDG